MNIYTLVIHGTKNIQKLYLLKIVLQMMYVYFSYDFKQQIQGKTVIIQNGNYTNDDYTNGIQTASLVLVT